MLTLSPGERAITPRPRERERVARQRRVRGMGIKTNLAVRASVNSYSTENSEGPNSWPHLPGCQQVTESGIAMQCGFDGFNLLLRRTVRGVKL